MIKHIVLAAMAVLALAGCVTDEFWVRSTHYQLKFEVNCPSGVTLEIWNYHETDSIGVTWPDGVKQKIQSGKRVKHAVIGKPSTVTVKVDGFEPDTYHPTYCRK